MADAVQTAYSVDAPFGAAHYGHIDDSFPSACDTRIALGAIPFGRLVVVPAAGSAFGCALPATTGEVSARALGISVKDQTRRQTAGAASGYATDDAVRILRKGRIRVQVDETVLDGENVFANFNQAGLNGAFRNDANTGVAVQVPRCVFRKGGTTTTGAILEVDFPAPLAASTGF